MAEASPYHYTTVARKTTETRLYDRSVPAIFRGALYLTHQLIRKQNNTHTFDPMMSTSHGLRSVCNENDGKEQNVRWVVLQFEKPSQKRLTNKRCSSPIEARVFYPSCTSFGQSEILGQEEV